MISPKTFIALTDEQRTQLEPLFAAITEANRLGKAPAIGAQVYPDGMVVTLFDESQVRRIQETLEGRWVEGQHRTAWQRLNAEVSV